MKHKFADLLIYAANNADAKFKAAEFPGQEHTIDTVLQYDEFRWSAIVPTPPDIIRYLNLYAGGSGQYRTVPELHSKEGQSSSPIGLIKITIAGDLKSIVSVELINNSNDTIV